MVVIKKKTSGFTLLYLPNSLRSTGSKVIFVFNFISGRFPCFGRALRHFTNAKKHDSKTFNACVSCVRHYRKEKENSKFKRRDS